MYRQIMCFLVLLLGVITINAQTINLRGKVSNQAGKPIANAILTLVSQGLRDTTAADGAYSLTKNDVSVMPLLTPKSKVLSLNNGFLEFSLPEASPVKIDILDLRGKIIKKGSIQNVSAGFYRFNILENIRTAKLFIIKATIGQDEVTFRYLPMSGKFTMNSKIENSMPLGGKLAKISAVNDSLKITASGYTTKTMMISSYEQELNITLDTIESGTAGRSAGCGKTTTLKGEQTLKISTGGKERSYILRLPDDYNSSKAYRLIISIHCLNGTARGVASGGSGNGYEYYGLWKLANPKNSTGTTIFASPEGLPAMGSGLGWSNSGGSDVEFIRAMVNKFETDLCIDTTRIFAEGFSMGGSMSYALSCAMPNKFRAVCMHSGGSMSGCSGTSRGPVPMYITHGTNDGVCKWTEHYGENQINDLAKRSGCDVIDLFNTCKPTDQSGNTPVTVNYKNCNPGFPFKASIFVGDHTPSPGGEKNTWVDDSTWNYFKQF